MNNTNATPQDKSLLNTLRTDDPESFEQFMLIALYTSPEFLAATEKANLCWDVQRGKMMNIFDYPRHYALYQVIRNWRSASPTGNLSDALLLTYLTAIAAQPMPPIEEEDIMETAQLFRDLLTAPEMSAENALAAVKDTWREWAQAQSFKLIATRFLRTMDNPQEAARQLAARALELNSSAQDTEAEFGDGMDSNEYFIERMALGHTMAPLNKCLGGGIGKKEHIMFIAPTGGGKTVLACQIAADLASNGRQVLYVTTEQHSRELEPRIISCLSAGTKVQIPFSIIKDGVKKEQLTGAQWDTVAYIRKSLRGNLHFENWIAAGMSVSDDLDVTIRRWNDKLALQGKQLDCIVFDWIGGALAYSATGAKNELRLIYQEAATTLKNVAYVHNLATISFAQAVTAATKKAHLDGTDMAENKTMHNEAVAAFGVSALREKEESGSNASYSTVQYIHCFKARKDKSLVAKLTRDFKFQRFLFDDFASINK